MSGDGNYSQPITASTQQVLLGTNTRSVRCDAQGRLEVVAGAGVPVDVNIIQVAGTAVEEGGIAGSLGVGGLAAHDAAAEGDPVQVGGVYVAAPGNVGDGDAARFLTDINGRLAIDLQRLNSVALAGAGVDGVFVVGGDTADDAAESLLYPLKMGAVGSQNPLADSIDDGDMGKLLVDLQRHLRTVPRSYNPTTDADKVENQNLISDDYDESPIVIANVSDIAVARTNYPSDDGQPIGSRNRFGWIVGMRDGEFDLEISNGDGNWVVATRTMYDVVEGQGGYTAAAHYTEADVTTEYWGVTWQDLIEFTHYRFAFTPNNVTSIFYVLAMSRAN